MVCPTISLKTKSNTTKIFSGIVKRRWKPQYVGKLLNVELFLKANHIQVNNDDNSLNLLTPDIREQHENFWIKHNANPLEGRDVILKSICPEVSPTKLH